MTNNNPTHARFPGSPLQHLLVAGTKTTWCGKDASRVARYSMADLPSGERTKGRPCPKCRLDKGRG